MLRYLIRVEGGRSLSLLLLGALAGWLLGSVRLGALFGLTLILFIHLYHAGQLLAWLQAPKKRELPDGVGIWRDIFQLSLDRHKQARKRKKRLGAIVREFRASTTALPDAAVVLDRSGCIVWYNQAAVSLLALRGQPDIGLRINNLLRHPDFHSYFGQSDAQDRGVEIPAPSDSESTLWIRVIPYGDGQRLLIARDVTELKRLEVSRRDFVANASHELRTPLTVLRGYLDMMGEESSEAGQLSSWKNPIEEMRRQSARMQRIIADLLRLANLESGSGFADSTVLDMPALIGAALEEAEHLSGGQHRIESEVDDSLQLQGEQADLHSVVSNLLSNALRYTPPGGRIRLRWQRDGGQALLSVQDTGIGIAARDIPRLTERFYRADVARSRETGGTGLGLAIVKHALERHEAVLTIHSQPGRGSEFICRFPAHRMSDNSRVAVAG